MFGCVFRFRGSGSVTCTSWPRGRTRTRPTRGWRWCTRPTRTSGRCASCRRDTRTAGATSAKSTPSPRWWGPSCWTSEVRFFLFWSVACVGNKNQPLLTHLYLLQTTLTWKTPLTWLPTTKSLLQTKVCTTYKIVFPSTFLRILINQQETVKVLT